MGFSQRPEPANLLVGTLLRRQSLLDNVRSALERQFGRIDEQSDPVRFDFTDYYEPEMGENLQRVWFGFVELRMPDFLADCKRATNALEDSWRDELGRRQVNLDPGFLTQYNLVLATTKNYAHRVYLRDGIYAEVTLRFQHGRFQPLEWTYPDYRSEAAQVFLTRVRAGYLNKLAASRPPRTEG
jgi:hypothetical protein